MKNTGRWATASILSVAMGMLLIAPSAFAAGPRAKIATTNSSQTTSIAPAQGRQSVAGWLENFFGGNYLAPQPRPYKTSAAIIGGSAATGAVVGGLLKGKKGAIIGALTGGAAGWYYDHKTSHR